MYSVFIYLFIIYFLVSSESSLQELCITFFFFFFFLFFWNFLFSIVKLKELHIFALVQSGAPVPLSREQRNETQNSPFLRLSNDT